MDPYLRNSFAICHCEARGDEAIPMLHACGHQDCFIAARLATTRMGGGGM
jgi:hypothetical protein